MSRVIPRTRLYKMSVIQRFHCTLTGGAANETWPHVTGGPGCLIFSSFSTDTLEMPGLLLATPSFAFSFREDTPNSLNLPCAPPPTTPDDLCALATDRDRRIGLEMEKAISWRHVEALMEARDE